ncbi:MAG: hypothetical protein MJ069_01550 [Salinivirgaceae bacterium]|nr:hypothetical protein [Salinivirgaceae bacterium]
MKPRGILLFMAMVGLAMAAIALVFPPNGIKIDDNIVLNFRLNTPSHDTIATSSIIDSAMLAIVQNDDEPSLTETPNTDTVAKHDTLVKKEEPSVVQPLAQNHKSNSSKIQPIEYATTDKEHLTKFFAKLAKSNSKTIRILHYGDSQIEGDRITGYLRNLFQTKYGGSGPGLITAIPGIAKSSAIDHQASKNWQVYSIYNKKDTIGTQNRFGILGRFARFTPNQNSSEEQSAWIEFSPSTMAFKSVQNFTRCRIFYGYATKPFTVKGFVNDSLTWFESLEPIDQTEQLLWKFDKAPNQFRIELTSTNSPNIYAISLDAPTGVAVDNLPFRGSIGTEFVKLNFAQMAQMVKHLSVGLIIYEFGVNAVAYESKNYRFYEQSLRRQLHYLRQLMPEAKILVVSSSDMSEKTADGYVTKPEVAKVIEAQRNAAFAEGCAFWNLFEAMGGHNSMPQWVNAKLAQKDYTHFNRKGGHIVAQKLYDAIMAEQSK